MKWHVTEPADLYLRVMAVVLLVAGATMIFVGISSVIAFAVIVIGAVLVLTSLDDGNRRGGTAH